MLNFVNCVIPTKAVPRAFQERRAVSCCAEKSLEELNVGDILSGVVVRNKKGKWAFLDCNVVRRGKKGVDTKVDALLRPSRGVVENVGTKLVVEVKKPQPSSGRLEVARWKKVDAYQRRVEKSLESLSVGEELRGDVVHIYAGGALLDVGVDREGKNGKRSSMVALLRRSDFHPDWLSDADLVLKAGARVIRVGGSIPVYVRQVLVKNGHLRVMGEPKSLEAVQEEDRNWLRIKRAEKKKKAAEVPDVDSQRRGVVRKVLKYGVLVDIGTSNLALLHWKEMGEDVKYKWRDLLLEGTKVTVKVQEVINGENIRVRLITDQSKAVKSPALSRSSDKSPGLNSEKSPYGPLQKYGAENSAQEGDDDDDDEDEDHDEDDDDPFDDDPFDDAYFDEKYG